MYHPMFKAHDIRAKRECFAGEGGRRVAVAVAYYMACVLKADSIVLCRDARLGGETLLEEMVNTCSRAGLVVYVDPNPVGSCQFYNACMLHDAPCGVMITASHNPGSYLGMKLVGPDLSPISMESGLASVARAYEEGTPLPSATRAGAVKVIDTLTPYIEYSMALAHVGRGELSGLSIACEFLNGSSATAIMVGLGRAGVACTPLHPVPNGNFPLGEPNPGRKESMEEALTFIRTHQVPLLFAFDGDGDRMDLLVDGAQLTLSFVMYSIIEQLKALNPHEEPLAVLFDPKASPIVFNEIAGKGVQIDIVRNGHSAVKHVMRQSRQPRYLCAAEESAHYFYQLPTDPSKPDSRRLAGENTLFYLLLILKAFKENPKVFNEAQALQQSFYRRREWSITIPDGGQRTALLAQIEALMAGMGATRIEHDGSGHSLGAVLYRRGVDTGTYGLERGWLQLFQRISESEESLLRFEVIAENEAVGLPLVEALLALQGRFTQTT